MRRTDFPLLHWYAFMNLARVLELLDRIPDAASAADKAAEAPGSRAASWPSAVPGDGDTAAGLTRLVDPSCPSQAEAPGDPQAATFFTPSRSIGAADRAGLRSSGRPRTVGPRGSFRCPARRR